MEPLKLEQCQEIKCPRISDGVCEKCYLPSIMEEYRMLKTEGMTLEEKAQMEEDKRNLIIEAREALQQKNMQEAINICNEYIEEYFECSEILIIKAKALCFISTMQLPYFKAAVYCTNQASEMSDVINKEQLAEDIYNLIRQMILAMLNVMTNMNYETTYLENNLFNMWQEVVDSLTYLKNSIRLSGRNEIQSYLKKRMYQ